MSKQKKGIITTGRFEVHYRIYGANNTTTTPIVCVNGAQQSMAAWKSFISFFRKDHPVVIFDFPGQGRSKILYGSRHVHLSEQTEILQSVIKDGVGNRLVNLCSSSWGGAVAALFASQYSDRVQKLMLGSLGLSANNKMLDAINKAQTAIKNGKKEQCGEVAVESFGERIPAGLRDQILNQFASYDEDSLATFFEHMEWSASANLADEINFSNITAETLLVNGMNDPIIDVESLGWLEEEIPQCTRKVIGDTGHFLHFEDASIMNIYKEFFDQPSVIWVNNERAAA